MENLETSDLKVAQGLRDELERFTSETFAAIRSGKTMAAAALTAREQGILAREAIIVAADHDTGEPEGNPFDAALWAADAAAEGFRSEADRDAYLDALHGRDAVEAHLDAHLATLRRNKIVEKSVKEREGLILAFATWAAAQKPALTLDRIDRKQAGKYVAEKLDELHPKTQSKHLMALRGYWVQLAARGLVELPQQEPRGSGWPWNAQQIRNKPTRAERESRSDKERTFTEAEVKALLYAPYPEGMTAEHEAQIRDAIRMSLLSGMRMAEVLKLWVDDVKEAEDGAELIFDIQEGKTDAAARPVPVHPDLVDVVQRRLKDKDGNDKPGGAWLFHELADERDPGDTFGKRFARFRKNLGVADKREGKRRSLVNFHSARRWFATTAARAGQHDAVIQDVIGHEPDEKNVTRRYIAMSSRAQMRACVEAVKLPSP
ncbi:MAG: tyrosine-type recombinase/integrase [Proteobacteria bacterium]|nr:tyrosine-type recombinase/integrase [Pseudomonadota bacterium]